MTRNMLLTLAVTLIASTAGAQQGADAAARIRQALPAPQAEAVLAIIADAREAGLPDGALEHIAFQGIARAVRPEQVVSAVRQAAADFTAGRAAMAGVGRPSTSAEITAAGEALGRGVDGAAVSELARSAPSGRSLAVPLFVLGSLVDRGLPSDEALAAVLARLQARANDRELEGLPGQAGRLIAEGRRPADVGRILREARPVPTNPGRPDRGRP
jgi:hypothetical protein